MTTNFNFALPRIGRHGQSVAREQAQKGLGMARLGLADVNEWPDLAEIGEHLVVDRPRVVFIIKCLVEYADFGLGELAQVFSPF